MVGLLGTPLCCPVQEFDIFRQDLIHQHKAFILKALDSMYPEAFHTELSNSLTAFYKKILKKVSSGGCSLSKILPRKFEAAKVLVKGKISRSSHQQWRRLQQMGWRHRRCQRPPRKRRQLSNQLRAERRGAGGAVD